MGEEGVDIRTEEMERRMGRTPDWDEGRDKHVVDEDEEVAG